MLHLFGFCCACITEHGFPRLIPLPHHVRHPAPPLPPRWLCSRVSRECSRPSLSLPTDCILRRGPTTERSGCGTQRHACRQVPQLVASRGASTVRYLGVLRGRGWECLTTLSADPFSPRPPLPSQAHASARISLSPFIAFCQDNVTRSSRSAGSFLVCKCCYLSSRISTEPNHSSYSCTFP